LALAWILAPVRIDGLRDAALSWHIPEPVPVIRGLRLLMDAGPRAPAAVRVAREVLRSNPRLDPVDALLLATRALDTARARGVAPAFLAATLLQESAFDPRAMSAAGAVGIAQFTIPTARMQGVGDPWDPADAIDGSARLLAAYVAGYQGRGEDPYALALAAYNAGPGAVGYYGGVPPYPETREYIGDVRTRWSRIVGR
jgi:soluble lytic murein transglycosylase-like protein